MIVLYGIPNCDTIRKARAWLTEQGQACTFHDLRRQGIAPGLLASWIQAVGWETLLNRQGTTWRKLDAAARAAVVDAPSACSLMLANPSIIRRPVVDWGGDITVGFDVAVWAGRI
jgi:arsenate reductase